ncbi:unnamed protein product [Amoebophrya sp. A120]|nr:unnamed protein product [Amoebophrya sp. A120]|eukprot:GSA120T00022969001.1
MWKAQAAWRALRTPAPRLMLEDSTKAGKLFPVVPAELLWKFSPKWSTEDKWLFLWTSTKHACIAAGVLFWYGHQPFGGANYHDLYKTPLYRAYIAKLQRSGELAENRRLKRTSFYLPGEDVEESDAIPDYKKWDNFRQKSMMRY